MLEMPLSTDNRTDTGSHGYKLLNHSVLMLNLSTNIILCDLPTAIASGKHCRDITSNFIEERVNQLSYSHGLCVL